MEIEGPFEMDGDKFREIMRRMFSKPKYDGNNPAKYPRSVAVKDDKALFLIAEASLLEKAWRDTHNQLEEIKAKLEVNKNETFKRLREIYPEVPSEEEGGGGVGYRRWKGEIWFVSWDPEPEEE